MRVTPWVTASLVPPWAQTSYELPAEFFGVSTFHR